MNLWIILAGIDTSPLPHLGDGTKVLPTILSMFFAILGGIAVLVVTIAGFKYVISQGDPQQTVKAKNTILYAVIGIGVCLVAEALIKFVLDRTT